MADIKFE